MNKELKEKIIENIAKSSESGPAVRETIQEKIAEVDTLQGADTLEEVLGRQIAINKLKEIMKVFTPQKEVVKHKKPSYQ